MRARVYFKSIRLLGRSIGRRILDYEHELFMAVPPRHDDLYIVSFPKSGATWMNFLMANVQIMMSGSDRLVTFFNVHDFVPDIHVTRNIGNTKFSFPGYRVIKSHAEYNPYYQKVIYVVRDPRDTLISYYHFLRGLSRFDGSISKLVHSPVFGVEAWCRHLDGWHDQSRASLSISFIRYEDLIKDPRSTLNSMYALLGHVIPDRIMEAAIRLSSFDNMRALEQSYGYGGRDISSTLKFMRSGKSGVGKEEMSAEDLAYIEQVAMKWLTRFDYK